MALSGSLFSFASFSTDLRLRFGFTSSQINLLSAIGDTSMYVGFLVVGPIYDHLGPTPTMITASVLTFLGYGGMVVAYQKAWGGLGLLMVLYCLAGVASTAAYLAALATNMSNFPASSAGTLSGVLLACFGLSATLFSQIKTNLFAGEEEEDASHMGLAPKGTRATGQFLMFLTVVTTGVYVLAAMFMSKVDLDRVDGGSKVHVDEQRIQNVEDRSTDCSDEKPLAQACVHEPSEPETACSSPRGALYSTCTGDPTLSVQAVDDSQQAKQENEEKPRQQLYKDPEAGIGVGAGTGAAKDTMPSSFNPFLVPIEMKPRALLSEPTFWLFVLAQVLQQGFSYINNIDSIIHAILDAPNPAMPLLQSYALATAAQASEHITKTAVTLTGLHITLISVGNCLGRLTTGILSDLTLSRYRVSRSIFFFFSEVVLLVPLLLMSFSSPGPVSMGILIFNSCMIGITYGATSALFASMTRDFFGSKYYGTCCGMVMILNGFNPFLANQIYGLFYDRATDNYARSLAAAQGAAGLDIASTALKVPFLEGQSTLVPAAKDRHQEMCMAGSSCYEVSFRIAMLLQVACALSAGMLFVAHMRKGRRMTEEHECKEQNMGEGEVGCCD
ncbi:hypothetical protein KVV02_001865 [Mortierella alpina]|uniref:Nodulin-like domain-containing protein n=1 Tax=Mortierella alpina TaxID=64518 RepID=A0A9P7ZY65_MORAP|nr:hypothetical protein KVV02_001865 [Mortierella alpina]